MPTVQACFVQAQSCRADTGGLKQVAQVVGTGHPKRDSPPSLSEPRELSRPVLYLGVSRIQNAYDARFRALLKRAGARRLDAGVQWLMNKAHRVSAGESVPFSDALTRTCDELAGKPAFRRVVAPGAPDRFFCDAGLGGLARWLRAAGYDAFWEEGIDDDRLLVEGRRTGTTILTTDSMLMERRLLRDGVLPALWVPPTLGMLEQLALVFREYGLSVREHRCMSCGGQLRRVDKEAMRERIPPRTYRWLSEFFACSRCGKLFWHGSHWERIAKALSALKR